MIRDRFSDIFDHVSEQEQTEHDAQMIMFRFLSEIEKLAEKKGIKSRKELAQMVGITPGYLTQLYQGNKKLNLVTVAKFQRVLNVYFDINAIAVKMSDESRKPTSPKQPSFRKPKSVRKLLVHI